MKVQAINNNNNTNFRARISYIPDQTTKFVNRWSDISKTLEERTKDRSDLLQVFELYENTYNSMLSIVRSNTKTPMLQFNLNSKIRQKLLDLSNNEIVDKMIKILNFTQDKSVDKELMEAGKAFATQHNINGEALEVFNRALDIAMRQRATNKLDSDPILKDTEISEW